MAVIDWAKEAANIIDTTRLFENTAEVLGRNLNILSSDTSDEEPSTSSEEPTNGISIALKLNPGFELKPHQWWVDLLGRPVPESFDKAAEYNTRLNNYWSYSSIKERNEYYSWADTKARYLNCRWFGAAEIVTRFNAVGGAELPNLWYVSDEAEPFLIAGNIFLFENNMNTFKMLRDTSLNSETKYLTFINANKKLMSLQGQSDKLLDYSLVHYEQTLVEKFTEKYRKENQNVNMTSIFESIRLDVH